MLPRQENEKGQEQQGINPSEAGNQPIEPDKTADKSEPAQQDEMTRSESGVFVNPERQQTAAIQPVSPENTEKKKTSSIAKAESSSTIDEHISALEEPVAISSKLEDPLPAQVIPLAGVTRKKRENL